MEIKESLKLMIDNDIERIDEALQNPKLDHLEDLYNDIISKYSQLIIDFKDMLESYFYNMSGFGTRYNSLLRDLKKMKSKLVSCKNSGYETIIKYSKPYSMFDNLPQDTSKQVNFEMNFNNVKNIIRNNASLSQEDINEIIKQINEIEKIILSQELIPVKWQNLKPYINWLSNKSAEVALLIMPLFLNLKRN